MYSSDELFLCSLEYYFGVYFPRCFATREINAKITLVSAETVSHSSAYIILYQLSSKSKKVMLDVNTMPVDILAPCITRSSVTKRLTL